MFPCGMGGTRREGDLPMSDLLRRRLLAPDQPPVIMGILNVTPDSFSDGGAFDTPDAAVEHAVKLIAEGAEIIDVGPESTRPGSTPVPADVQLQRAIPVVQALRASDACVAISIDTRDAGVAEAALAAGADMVNDVSALRDDPRMADIVARSGAWVVLMHRRGDAATMQHCGGPHYDDVVDEILAFLNERLEWAVAHGVERERVVVDPGLGFGKRPEHNLRILKDLHRFCALGRPVLCGASRKRFIGMSLGIEAPADRDVGSFACAALAARAGASIFRVHTVRGNSEAARLGWEILGAGDGG